MQRYRKDSATWLQMSRGQRCRRSDAEVSQVCKKRRTCDVLLLLRPICVAGDAKNTDLRRYGPPLATVRATTCDENARDLRRRHPRRSSGAMTYTFLAVFVRFVAHLVNDFLVFGRFCAFRCPYKRRGSVGVKTCSRPRLHEREGPRAGAKRGEWEGRSERSERRVLTPMLPAAWWGKPVAARGSGMCHPLVGGYWWRLNN